MPDDRDQRKKEEEYFHRQEREAMDKMRQRLKTADEEPTQKASSMRCPKCGNELEEIEFQKIKVDQCTGCKGVWLDPGELERLVAREDNGWFANFWIGNPRGARQ